MLDFLVVVLVVGALAYGVRAYRARTRQPRSPGASNDRWGGPGGNSQH